jgi:CubicO group peptidase (beta-lactamase class C family)
MLSIKFSLLPILFASLATAMVLRREEIHSNTRIKDEINMQDNSTIQGFTKEGLAAFNAQFHKMVDNRKLANVVTLIARHGKVVDLDADGVLDVSATPKVPAKTDTIYRIASMTKPITGAAMMILFEEGKWALNDPISKHIPEFEGLKVKQPDGTLVPQVKPMIMAQLMSHSAGFDRTAAYASLNLRKGNLKDMINELAKVPLAFQPGKDWRYGPNVDIQGYLVEKLSGMGLDEFFQQKLFGPLGMVDTGFFVDPSKVGRLTRIHEYDKSGYISAANSSPVGTTKPKFLSGSGGLVSTAEDYWRFCQMILNGGESNGRRYLKAATVKIMHTNVLEDGVNVTINSPNTRGLGFGMDFAIVQDPKAARTSVGIQSFYWGGAFGTWFWIDPVNDMIVIGMIQNSGGTTPDGAPSVREASAKAAYSALHGV